MFPEAKRSLAKERGRQRGCCCLLVRLTDACNTQGWASREFSSGFLHVWQEAAHLDHHLLPAGSALAGSWSQAWNPGALTYATDVLSRCSATPPVSVCLLLPSPVVENKDRTTE